MKLETAYLSKLIHEAAEEAAKLTEDFVKTVETKPAGTDTVSVMVNGTEYAMGKEDYARLKEQTEALKARRKAEIKRIIGQYKLDLKNERTEREEDAE